MDAVPVTTETSSPAGESGQVGRTMQFAVFAVIGVGLAWRLVRYAQGFPIWGDEAMLLLNILDRDYVGLMQHLEYSQVAPLLFLWLEKTALLVFGPSEWSLHLLPTLAGVLALFLFWRLASRFLSPLAAGFAVGVLAVSYYPVRHACEVKPYAFDLLGAVVFAWLTLEHLRHPAGAYRWLAALIAITPLAVFTSYPSVFVGGSVTLVLLPTMRSANGTQRGLFALYNLALVGSFLVHYGMVGRHDAGSADVLRTREFLRDYWKDAFPPTSLAQWPTWLVLDLSGNMLAYPVGSSRGGSSATLLLVLVGAVALWRSGQRSLLALCGLPFGFNLVAAILDKYPFGSSARIAQHLAPFICILMACGLADLLQRVRSSAWRARLHLGICAVLLACGVVGIVRDLRQPYKTEHDLAMRRLARDVARQAGSDPVLMCHPLDKHLLAEFVWYFRTEVPTLAWLSDHPSINSRTDSCWLLLCGHQEPTVSDVLAYAAPGQWRVAETDVRLVPPENAKMMPVHCRKVRLVRNPL